MKMSNIILLIGIILITFIGIGYLFLDIIISLGIISPSVDIRTELLIIGYSLIFILLLLLFIKVLIKKENLV